MTKTIIRCCDCKRTFKTERAFQAHADACVATLVGNDNPTLEQLMAVYEARARVQ